MSFRKPCHMPFRKLIHRLISERHSAGIELIILIRKNLCSRFVSEEKSHEKELFAEILILKLYEA